jgi:hypothetical protein
MDAPAVPLLGLIGAFDRASVPDAQPTIGDTGSITSSCAGGPCGIHRPVLYSPAGSQGLPRQTIISVRIAAVGHSKSCKQATLSRTAPLPYFGDDRIGDFGQVGTANLWKSAPLFSTGTKEAELMHEELRLNPRSPGARSWGRSPGEHAATDSKKVKGSLSTGFAEGGAAESTGRSGRWGRQRR